MRVVGKTGAGGCKDFAPDGATERGSATRSGFGCSKAFGLSDDVNRGRVLRLTEPRSNRNAVATFSPVAANVSWLKPLPGRIGADSRPLLQAQR